MHFPKCNRFDRNIQSWDGCRGEHTLTGRRERTPFADKPPSILHLVVKLSTAALALQFAAVVDIEKTRYRKCRILDWAWKSAVPTLGRLGRKNYDESRQGEAV